MTIKVTHDGASFSKPGTYPAVKVLNLTGFPLAPTGIVGIIGEAVGGEPSVLDVLEGPQIQAAKSRYKSGPIADALGLLTAPSKDGRIANGASKVIVFKTNQGTRASKFLKNSATVGVDMVKLLTKNWGTDENNVSVLVTAGATLDADAKLTGTVNGPFTLAGGETLIVKSNGTTYTFTNTLTGSTTAAALVAELNTAARWSGSVKPVIASVSGSAVAIALDPTVVTDGKLDYGFLVIDATSTLDTIVGITGSARGVRGTRFVVFKKGSLTESSIPELGGPSVVKVKYVGSGTSCKLSIKDVSGQRLLTTTCAGAAADDQSIVLGTVEAGVLVPKMTVQELVDQLNNLAAYEVSTSYSNPSLNAIELDFYDDVRVDSVDMDLRRDIEDFVQQVSLLSTLVNAERQSNVYATLKTVTTAEFLSGGTDGTATNTDYSNGYEALKLVRTEQVVPLISADRGSLSIATINALADSHVRHGWSAAGRSPRQAVCSLLGTKAQVKSAAGALNSGFTQLVAQDPQVFSFGQGKLAFLDPWALACLAAGMRAGSSVGEPNTFKIANVNGVRVRDGSWNPKVDFTEMIDAGVTILEPMDGGGFRWVVDNTTYSTDGSFVYNRASVVEAVGFVFYDLMINLELLYTGTKARSGSAQALAGTCAARMALYLEQEIIVGDDDNKGKGFKNLRVQITGNRAAIDVTITPVQGIDFILPTIYLADIKQSA